MPYHLSKDGKTVMGPGGKPVPGGKHGSKASALRHLRALYANVKKSDVVAETLQKGDVAGHEFHGNQWTGAGVPSGLPSNPSAVTEKLAAQHAERMSKFEVDKEGNLTRKTGALVTTIAPSPYNKNLLEVSHYREIGGKSESLNIGPQKTYATQYEAARIATIEHASMGARLERQALPKESFFNAPEKYSVKKGDIVTNYSAIFSELMKGDMPEGTRVYLREADGKFAKGDVPGHEFHGNQYSEGGGSGGSSELAGTGAKADTKEYSWGKLTTVADKGGGYRAVIHPENREAIAKLEPGKTHIFTDEQGHSWAATRAMSDNSKIQLQGIGHTPQSYRLAFDRNHVVD